MRQGDGTPCLAPLIEARTKSPNRVANELRNGPDSRIELTDILSMCESTPEAKEFFWIEQTSHSFESYSYVQASRLV